MPIDSSEPRTPGWWLVTLQRELELRNKGTHSWRRTKRRGRPGLNLLDDYLNGDPPLPHVAEGWGLAMRPFLRQCRLNVAELVVESVRDRMIPLGWSTAIDANDDGDQVAARVATANDLDLQLGDVFDWMLSLGAGYVILGRDPKATEDDAVPLITAEDPREVITAEDPQTRRTIAGLKMYRDEWDSQDVAYLYLPGEVWRATRGKRGAGFTGWEWDPAQSPKEWPPGFEDFLPVFSFINRRGVGEYEPHLDVLDRINDQIFTRVVIAKYQAFRQRAVQNLPVRDEHGREIDYSETFTADPGAFWQVPADVTFWESTPIDLNPIRQAVRDDIEHLAAMTRTPMYMITPDAAAGSAEGASTQREGLIFRVTDRRRRADAALRQMMAAAFKMMGETQRADAVLSIKTIWQPAERFSLQERTAAAATLKGSKALPSGPIYTDVLQYGPEDIERLRREEAADMQREAEAAALLEAAKPPPPAPAAPQGAAESGGAPSQPGSAAQGQNPRPPGSRGNPARQREGQQ